jgi:hypothetical protein
MIPILSHVNLVTGKFINVTIRAVTDPQINPVTGRFIAMSIKAVIDPHIDSD